MAIDRLNQLYEKMSIYGDTYGNNQEDLDATQQDQETGIGEILIPNINTSYSGLNSGNNNQYYNNNQLTALRDNALATRQERLNNPGMLQGIINSGMEMIGMTPQRSTLEMMTSGEKDVRKTSGIPLGISGLISRALPNNYYDKMTLADQIFVQSQTTNKALPTVFDSGNSIANRDEFGINKTSMFGNYGEYVVERADELKEQLEKSKIKHEKEYGNLNNVNKYGKTWAQMNKMNLSALSKYTPLKYQYQAIPGDLKLIKQAQDIKEKKIAKEAEAQEEARKAAANRAGQIAAEVGADVGVSGGGRGSRRGDADISESSRGNYATDDTAGFFARGGRIRYGKGGIVSL